MLSSIKLFLKSAKINVHTQGLELVPDDGKYLLVSNHLSVFDPMIAITALEKKNLAFVAKPATLHTRRLDSSATVASATFAQNDIT